MLRSSQQEAPEIPANELKMAKAMAEEALNNSLKEDKLKKYLLRPPHIKVLSALRTDHEPSPKHKQ